jgi:hypothetical protein
MKILKEIKEILTGQDMDIDTITQLKALKNLTTDFEN